MSTKEKRPAAKVAVSKKRSTSRRKQTSRGDSHRKQMSRSSQLAQKSAAHRQSAQSPERKKSVRRAESQVVYTPPKTFSKFRLLLGLISVAAIVLALTLGMSIFFKVENINVSGMQKYTAWDISEASGIQVGDNLMTLGKARVSGKIIAQLPYVEQVRVGIKLPDTVNIEVVESEVIYTIQADDLSWWIINSQGRVLEPTTAFIAEHFTMVEGVYITTPVTGQQAAASDMVTQETVPTEETEEGSTEETAEPTSPVNTVSGNDRLTVALAILQCLEQNGVVGEATSVNVADPYNLVLWYDNRYEVLLGESTQLDYKIRAMLQAAQQMTDYQQGTLDASFTIWPDMIGYTPFKD